MTHGRPFSPMGDGIMTREALMAPKGKCPRMVSERMNFVRSERVVRRINDRKFQSSGGMWPDDIDWK